MSGNPWDPVFPDHLRRQLEEQAKQFAKLREQLAPSIEAAQQALKTFGGFGLDAGTLAALKALQPPIGLTRMYGPPPELLKAIAEMRTRIEIPAPLFGDIGATLARALEIPRFLRDLGLPSAEEMRKGLKRFVRAAEALAKAGWTFPMEMTPRGVVELADEMAGDPGRLDQWFLDYYAEDDRRAFRDLTRRLLRNERLVNWRAVLRECLCAYKRGLYRIMVPSLLATIEGLVCELTDAIREKHVKVTTHWQEGTIRPPDGAIVEAQWCATMAFLESLWCRYDFDQPAPGKLNRHWVLHGRRPQVGGQADALRLLVAVEFIADAGRNVACLGARPRRKRARSLAPAAIE